MAAHARQKPAGSCPRHVYTKMRAAASRMQRRPAPSALRKRARARARKLPWLYAFASFTIGKRRMPFYPGGKRSAPNGWGAPPLGAIRPPHPPQHPRALVAPPGWFYMLWGHLNTTILSGSTSVAFWHPLYIQNQPSCHMDDGWAPGGWYEPAYGPLRPLGWFCMYGGCPQLATLGGLGCVWVD